MGKLVFIADFEGHTKVLGRVAAESWTADNLIRILRLRAEHHLEVTQNHLIRFEVRLFILDSALAETFEVGHFRETFDIGDLECKELLEDGLLVVARGSIL